MSTITNPEVLRQKVRDWLAHHWTGADDRKWRLDVVLAGWAAPTFPTDAYGLGLTPGLAKVVRAEFDAVGAPGSCRDLDVDAVAGWVRMAGMAVAQYGGKALKETFV